jgi:hypothetical protein
MLQLFHLDVAKVDQEMLQVFQKHVTSVCLKCFISFQTYIAYVSHICCNSIFQMFQLFQSFVTVSGFIMQVAILKRERIGSGSTNGHEMGAQCPRGAGEGGWGRAARASGC